MASLTEQVLLHGLGAVEADGALLEDVLQELGSLRQAEHTVREREEEREEAVSSSLGAAGRFNESSIKSRSGAQTERTNCKLLKNFCKLLLRGSERKQCRREWEVGIFPARSQVHHQEVHPFKGGISGQKRNIEILPIPAKFVEQ